MTSLEPVLETIYTDAISHFGIKNQMIKTMEECGELIQSISKFLLEPEYHQLDLLEELADVQIMINQLSLVMGRNQFEHFILMKTDRLRQRIKK